MSRPGFQLGTVTLSWLLSIGLASAADTPVTQVDWNTRTASCPAKVTQSTNVIIRLTSVNDLLIDFKTGETAQYQLRVKGSPVSIVAPENLFLQAALVAGCTDAQVQSDVAAVKAIKDPMITPPQPGGRFITRSETADAAHSHPEVGALERDIANSSCADFINARATDPAVAWVKRLDSAAPPSIDFNVNLEPNQNYQYTIQQSWKGKTVDGATLTWNCGETDILTLSAGPLITTLPYRTYNQQLVPNPGGTGTQNVLVVSGTSNVNVLAAALLNYHFPAFPHQPQWTGLALSVGPVYALNSAPSVSKLGLFVGGSIQMYRSVFVTPGIHIGEFADFPAGFHSGSPIPPNFGNLTPVTRNTAHFAIGVTFKTTTFKKSSQNNGAAVQGGATPGGSSPAPGKPQAVTGSHGGGSVGSQVSISSIELAPATLVGGNAALGTLKLSAAAPAGGLVVTLSSSVAAAATVPGSINVAAGQNSATFAVTTTAVTASTSVNISATVPAGAKSTTLVVQPQ